MRDQARQRQDPELWRVTDTRRSELRVIRSGADAQRRKDVPGRSRPVSGASHQHMSEYDRAARRGQARPSGRNMPVRDPSMMRGQARPSGRNMPVRDPSMMRGQARPSGRNMPVRDPSMMRGQARPSGAYRTPPARQSVRTMPARRNDTYRSAERAKRQRARQRALRRRRRIAMLTAAVLIVIIFFAGKAFYQKQAALPGMKEASERLPVALGMPEEEQETMKGPPIQEDLLSISEYNRPGTELACVRNIFVHYTANPNTSAAQNRSYFESLGETHERAASAHFIIGCEGEIIQCIPLDEEAYAVVGRNGDSISIECCYIDKDGSFTKETYDSLIRMLAWLTDQYDLEPQDILRHYDCGGKRCPLYYVEHEDAWQALLSDVAAYKGL